MRWLFDYRHLVYALCIAALGAEDEFTLLVVEVVCEEPLLLDAKPGLEIVVAYAGRVLVVSRPTEVL